MGAPNFVPFIIYYQRTLGIFRSIFTDYIKKINVGCNCNVETNFQTGLVFPQCLTNDPQ